MVDVFGATSTTEDVLSGVNLKGKRILVTGVSAGIGVETARSLAAHGAHVVGAARDSCVRTQQPVAAASS
jgi:NAD(P)-dependent dehydrogenase (short-subunit alcohol dehydrogenase family)